MTHPITVHFNGIMLTKNPCGKQNDFSTSVNEKIKTLLRILRWKIFFGYILVTGIQYMWNCWYFKVVYFMPYPFPLCAERKNWLNIVFKNAHLIRPHIYYLRTSLYVSLIKFCGSSFIWKKVTKIFIFKVDLFQ